MRKTIFFVGRRRPFRPENFYLFIFFGARLITTSKKNHRALKQVSARTRVAYVCGNRQPWYVATRILSLIIWGRFLLILAPTDEAPKKLMEIRASRARISIQIYSYLRWPKTDQAQARQSPNFHPTSWRLVGRRKKYIRRVMETKDSGCHRLRSTVAT